MWRDLFRHGLAPITFAACLGEGVYALNSFLVSTAMPVAVLEVGGVRLIAWTTSLYMVAAIVSGSAAGFLKTRLGARRLLLAAAGLFLAGTLAAGAAGTMPVILFGRALQGAGEGAIAASCYALVAERLPRPLLPKAFGLMAVVWALAAFGGPLLGGLATETLSWRAAFLLNVPLIAAFAALVLHAVPPGGAARTTAPLPLGRLMGVAGGILLFTIASVSTQSWLAALLVITGFAVLAAVFLADRKSAARLYPRDAFIPTTTLGAGLWVVLLMPLGQASTSVFLPITVQSLWGYSPTASGALIGTLALSWSGAAVLVALPHDSRLAVPFIRGGALLLALGLAGATLALPAREPLLLVLCQVVVGIGFGIGWAFLNQMVVAAAREGERDLASTLVPTTQSAGYAIGAAVAGLTANASGYSAALAARSDGATGVWVFGVGTALAVAAALISLRVAPSRYRRPREA